MVRDKYLSPQHETAQVPVVAGLQAEISAVLDWVRIHGGTIVAQIHTDISPIEFARRGTD